MFSKTPDMVKRLNLTLAQNPVWRTLAETTTDVINELVHDKRWALSRIREAETVQRGDWMDTPIGRGKVTLVRRYRSNVNDTANTYEFEDVVEVQIPNRGFVKLPVRTLQDRRTLIAGSKLSGFDYFSDFLQDDDYARIHSYVGKYWNASGGDRFVDFLGYITRTRFEIDALWEPENGDPGLPSNTRTLNSPSDEYVQLEPYSSFMTKVWKEPNFDFDLGHDEDKPGLSYPTSHVQLSWDVIDHPTIDMNGVASLFYYLAPIHLVLERFAATVYAHEDTYAASTVQGHTIPQYTGLWDNTALIEWKAGLRAQAHSVPQYTAQVPNPLPAP